VEKALADINRAIELNPDNVGEDAYNPYLLSSSIHYFYTDEILKALSDINFAIELRSDLAEVFSLRGRINGALEKYDDAIADYSKSLSILPDDAYVLNLRGNVYSTMREYDDAIADFSRSISLVSDNANFYINRGYAYANRGYEGIAAGNLDDIRRALADIDTALKLDPENATTMRWRETLREVLDQ
jgi:tetratricopeptide (TPR) repeat protein